MAVQAPPTTADEELLLLPDDGLRHEFVQGELRTMSRTGFEHGRLTARAARLLDNHAVATERGAVPGFAVAVAELFA